MANPNTPEEVNRKSIDKIIDNLYALSSPKIEDSRKDKIKAFITSTINGDISKAYAVTKANLSKDRKGILIYVLTDCRVIKIEIDSNKEKSQSYQLSKIISISRESDGDRAKVQVYFENDTFGLWYNQKEEKITKFFQELDKVRLRGVR